MNSWWQLITVYFHWKQDMEKISQDITGLQYLFKRDHADLLKRRFNINNAMVIKIYKHLTLNYIMKFQSHIMSRVHTLPFTVYWNEASLHAITEYSVPKARV